MEEQVERKEEKAGRDGNKETTRAAIYKDWKEIATHVILEQNSKKRDTTLFVLYTQEREAVPKRFLHHSCWKRDLQRTLRIGGLSQPAI